MYSDLSANIHQDATISEVDIMIKSKKKNEYLKNGT